MVQERRVGDISIEADERLHFYGANGEELAALDGSEADDLIRWLAEDVRGRSYTR